MIGPGELNHILTSWAAWLEAGKPVPFNAYPPQSFITRIGRDNFHQSPKRSKPLWHGTMKSYWLQDVDRVLRTLPDSRLILILGSSLPGKATQAQRAQEMGATLEMVRYARRKAGELLETI